LNEVVPVGPILIWAVVIYSNIYNIRKSGMTLFQFGQMFLLVPKFECSCFNYPKWSRLLEFAQMFL